MNQTKLHQVLALLLLGSALPTHAQTTAFTYQGKLNDNGSPANGNYDLRFYLRDALAAGNPVGTTNTLAPVPVSNGLFSVTLDFGSGIFTGSARWLEMAVRTNGSGGAHTVLSPRQPLTAAPYALYASNAGAATFATTATSASRLTLPYIVTNSIDNHGLIEAYNTHPNGAGVYANGNVYGIQGDCTSAAGIGVVGNGRGASTYGVFGQHTPSGNYGALGLNYAGTYGQYTPNGNYGELGTANYGVYGLHSAAQNDGRLGDSIAGVRGVAAAANSTSVGVRGEHYTSGNFGYLGGPAVGIYCYSASGAAVMGQTVSGKAGQFLGPVEVTGTLTTCVLSITGGCDVSEPFQISGQNIPKGSLVTIDKLNPGQLKLSDQPYDKRVAGIVSGANGINPGISLSQQGVVEGGQNVALSGRVYALADASQGEIEPGDLLTTSTTPGHCMKAADPAKSQGASIGKAMSALKEGKGMVLVLVSLQ
jgi:hypothetical protein